MCVGGHEIIIKVAVTPAFNVDEFDDDYGGDDVSAARTGGQLVGGSRALLPRVGWVGNFCLKIAAASLKLIERRRSGFMEAVIYCVALCP